MASNYNIEAAITLSGEAEFRKSVTSATASLKEISSESKLVSEQFQGQQNTMEALRAQHEVLVKSVAAHKEKQEALSAALGNAKKNQESIYSSLQKLLGQWDEETAKLEELKRIYGESSDEVKEQEKKVKELSDAIKQGERNYETAGNRVQRWQTQLNNAQTETIRANRALEQNEQYLNEAAEAADGCAASIDEFGRQVSGSADELEESADAASSWSDKFKGAFANKVTSVAVDALGALKDKAVEAAKYVVEVGSSFEAAMSEVEAISGAAGSDLESLTQKAKEMGSTTKFTATEAAEAFKYMSLAGWNTQQMLSGVDGVLNLAAASGMELASASDMITDYLSAFNMEAEQAAYMADMMAYAQANSNTTAEQLGEAYGNCAANLNTAGQDIETVTSLLEAMANQGLKGSEAGTALGSIMTQITQKMEDGRIQIGETLVAVADSNGNFRDLTDILTDVGDALEGMGTEERSAALAATFNKTALSGLNLVLNEGMDKVAGYEEALRDADSTAAGMAETMQDNLSGDMTKASSALEGLGIAAYEYVEGPVRSVVQGVTGVISGITDAITPQKTELQEFIEELQESNDSVKEMLDNVQQMVSDASSNVGELEVYKDTLLDLNGIEEKNEYQKYQIKKIVTELADSIPQLAAAFDEETGNINLSNEAIKALIESEETYLLQQAQLKAREEAMNAMFEAEVNVAKATAAATQAEKDLNAAMEKNVQSANFLAGGAGDYCAEVADLQAAFNDANEAQEEAAELQKQAKKEYEANADAVKAATEKVQGYQDALDEMGLSAEEAAGDVQQVGASADALEDTTAAAEETAEAFENLKESVADSIESSVSMLNEFSGGTEVTADDIKKNLDSQIEGMGNWADNMKTLAGAAGQGMTQELYDALAEMGPQSANLVNTLVETLKSDMENGAGEFQTICQRWTEAMKLQDEADVIASYTSLGEGIASEATPKMEDSGEKMEKAAATGIEAGKPFSTKAMQEAAAETLREAQNNMGEFPGVGRNIMAGVAVGINANSQLVYNAVRTVMNNAKNEANKATDSHSPSRLWRNQVGLYMAQGLALGILDGKKDAMSASVELAKAAVQGTKEELGINSPSRIFKALGGYISEGLGVGIANKKGYASAASKAMAKEVYEASAEWMEEYKATHSVSLAEEKKFWKQLAQAVKKDSASYKEALDNAAQYNKFQKEVQNKTQNSFGVGWYTTKNKKKVKKDAEDYYGEVIKAAEKYVKNKKAADDISLQQEKYIWQQVQKHTKKGTKAYEEAAQKIKEVNQDIKQEQKTMAEIADEAVAALEDSIADKKRYSSLTAAEETAMWDNLLKTAKAKGKKYYKEVKKQAAEAKKEIREESREYGVSGAGLEAYKSLYKVSAYAEWQYWEQVAKSAGLSEAQQLEVQQNLLEAKENYYEQMKELEDDYYDKCNEVNEKLQDDVQELADAYTDALSERKTAIKDAFGMFDEFYSESEGPETLLANMQSQVAGYEVWMSQLEELEKRSMDGNRIISDEWLEELRDMGPEAAATIAALNMATDAQLAAMQEAYDAKNLLSQAQAEKELETLKKETEAQISALTAAAQAELDACKAEYTAASAELSAAISAPLQSLAEQATTLGENATIKLIMGLKGQAESAETGIKLEGIKQTVADGLSGLKDDGTALGKQAINKLTAGMKKRAESDATAETLGDVQKAIKSGLSGLKSKGETLGGNMLDGILASLNDTDKIKKSAAEFVAALEAAIKKEAGIASPSKRFRDVIGRQIPAGVEQGIEAGIPQAANAGMDMVNAMLEQSTEQVKRQQAALAECMAGINGNAGIAALNDLVASPVRQMTNVTVNNTGVAEMVGSMTAEIRALRGEISRMKIMLDKDILVGELAEPIGDELAMQAIRL